MKNKINLIACVCEDNGIGYKGKIPWYLPEDLKFFREKTLGYPVIMGKNTYFSLGKSLEGRQNVVISTSLKSSELPLDVILYKSFEDCLELLEFSDIFVIGGEVLYNKTLEIADTIYLTQIYEKFDCDTFFPEIKNFKKQESSGILKSKNVLYYQYFVYNRKSQEYQYLDLLSKILKNGIDKSDRTGVGTKSIFGVQMRFDISKEFPLLTTKKVPFKTIIKELLWFISGSTNSKLLENQGVNIWKGNTSREFLDNLGLLHLPEGDIGPMYGFQWRHWGAHYYHCNAKYEGIGIDQLANVIKEIKTNPNSRRLIVTALNPSFYQDSVLLPCHTLFQFYVNDGYLSCHLYQRSGDMFLGVPFNIASYSALTYAIAKITGLKPGTFIHSIGDAHIYNNHIPQVKEQLSREPKKMPSLHIKSRFSIDDFDINDFELSDYDSHPYIKGVMAI